jgi:hypothetical protein
MLGVSEELPKNGDVPKSPAYYNWQSLRRRQERKPSEKFILVRIAGAPALALRHIRAPAAQVYEYFNTVKGGHCILPRSAFAGAGPFPCCEVAFILARSDFRSASVLIAA